jgi:hypothetical protein
MYNGRSPHPQHHQHIQDFFDFPQSFGGAFAGEGRGDGA